MQEDYIQPIDTSHEWNQFKHIIIAFDFPEKWTCEYDDSAIYFTYKLNVGFIQIYYPSIMLNRISMKISDFDKNKFKDLVMEKYPQTIWPTKN